MCPAALSVRTDNASTSVKKANVGKFLTRVSLNNKGATTITTECTAPFLSPENQPGTQGMRALEIADLIGFSLLDYIQPNRVLRATCSLCTRPNWRRGINGLGDDGVQFVNPFLSLPPSLPPHKKTKLQKAQVYSVIQSPSF